MSGIMPDDDKKVLDLTGFSDKNILDHVEKIKRHGFGEVRIEIYYGEVKKVFVTESFKTER